MCCAIGVAVILYVTRRIGPTLNVKMPQPAERIAPFVSDRTAAFIVPDKNEPIVAAVIGKSVAANKMTYTDGMQLLQNFATLSRIEVHIPCEASKVDISHGKYILYAPLKGMMLVRRFSWPTESTITLRNSDFFESVDVLSGE